jgi:hypothetical protein
MGPEIALALMAGGTAAQAVGSRQQAKQQRSILNRAFEKNDRSTKQSTSDVLGQGATETGAAQMADMGTAADAIAARTGADLKGAGADLIDAAGDNGAQSQAFLTAKADRALSEGNRQTAIARELAKVRSTGEVQNNNAMARGSLMEEIASRGNTNRAQTQAATLDAQSVQAPLISDLGKIASMAGMAGGLGGFGAAGGGAGAELAMTDIGVGAASAGAGGGMSPMAASLARLAPMAGMFGRKRGAGNSMFGGQ